MDVLLWDKQACTELYADVVKVCLLFGKSRRNLCSLLCSSLPIKLKKLFRENKKIFFKWSFIIFLNR